MHRHLEPQLPSVGRYREESTRRRLCGIILAGVVLTVIISVSVPNKDHVVDNGTKNIAKSSFRGSYPVSQISKQHDFNSTKKIMAKKDLTLTPTMSPLSHQSISTTLSVSPTIIGHAAQGAESPNQSYTTFPSVSPVMTQEPSARPTDIIHDADGAGLKFPDYTSFPSISPTTTTSTTTLISEETSSVTPTPVPTTEIPIPDNVSEKTNTSITSSPPSLSPTLSHALTTTPTAIIHDAEGAGLKFPDYISFPSISPTATTTLISEVTSSVPFVPTSEAQVHDNVSEETNTSITSSLPSLSPILSHVLTTTPTAIIHDADGAGLKFPDYTSFPSTSPTNTTTLISEVTSSVTPVPTMQRHVHDKESEETYTSITSSPPSLSPILSHVLTTTSTAIIHDAEGAGLKFPDYTSFPSISPTTTTTTTLISEVTSSVTPTPVPTLEIHKHDNKSEETNTSITSSPPSLSPSQTHVLTTTPTAIIHDAEGAGLKFPDYTSFPSISPGSYHG